jgi:hypothetical protein
MVTAEPELRDTGTAALRGVVRACARAAAGKGFDAGGRAGKGRGSKIRLRSVKT